MPNKLGLKKEQQLLTSEVCLTLIVSSECSSDDQQGRGRRGMIGGRKKSQRAILLNLIVRDLGCAGLFLNI